MFVCPPSINKEAVVLCVTLEYVRVQILKYLDGPATCELIETGGSCMPSEKDVDTHVVSMCSPQSPGMIAPFESLSRTTPV